MEEAPPASNYPFTPCSEAAKGVDGDRSTKQASSPPAGGASGRDSVRPSMEEVRSEGRADVGRAPPSITFGWRIDISR